MIARRINDKNADMDYYAVPPPEYQVAGDSKRENLCQPDSERFTMTTTGASSCSRYPSETSEGKVHLQANAEGENSNRKREFFTRVHVEVPTPGDLLLT